MPGFVIKENHCIKDTFDPFQVISGFRRSTYSLIAYRKYADPEYWFNIGLAEFLCELRDGINYTAPQTCKDHDGVNFKVIHILDASHHLFHIDG